MKKPLAAIAASLLLVTLPVTGVGHVSAEAGTDRPTTYPTTRPTTYVVSDEPGVLPEGISVSPDGTMYVTSAGTGTVYRGNTRRPTMDLFLPAGTDGRTQAAGVHTDERGRLFIAGYSTSALFVYNPDGTLAAKRVAPVAGAALNDLVITDDAVYVTDSATGILWRAALRGSQVGALTAWLQPSDFPVRPGFLNGIVTATTSGWPWLPTRAPAPAYPATVICSRWTCCTAPPSRSRSRAG
jgi:hypothetical protein